MRKILIVEDNESLGRSLQVFLRGRGLTVTHASSLDDARAQLDAERFDAVLLDVGLPDGSGIKHNVYQWDRIYENDNFYKGGWAGQGLLVNPTRDVVAVFTSYFKDDEYSEMDLEEAVFAVVDGVFGETGGGD